MPQIMADELPPEFQPRPIPCAFEVDVARPGGAGAGVVVLTVYDASGQRVIMLLPAHAQELADQLATAVPIAASSLDVISAPKGLAIAKPGQTGAEQNGHKS